MSQKIFPEEELQNKIRNCIRNYSELNGISRKELAERMGISVGVVKNYLSTKPISFHTTRNFAKALGYDESHLLKGLQWYKPSNYEEMSKRIDGLWNHYNDLEQRVKELEKKNNA